MYYRQKDQATRRMSNEKIQNNEISSSDRRTLGKDLNAAIGSHKSTGFKSRPILLS